MNTPCVSGFFGVSPTENDSFPHLSGDVGTGARRGLGLGELGQCLSVEPGGGSVDLSAKICAIDVLVEIMA